MDMHGFTLVYIENADATPPHLDVSLRFGISVDTLGILKFICHGGAQLNVCVLGVNLVA